MKTIEKIVYASEKGQITLPVAWRSQLDTNMFRIQTNELNNLEIVPVQAKQDEETGWVSVFDKERDNHGKGLTANEFLKALGRARNTNKKGK